MTSTKIDPSRFFEIKEGFPRFLKFLRPLVHWFIEKSVTVSRKIDDKRRYRSAERYFSAYSKLYDIPTVYFEKRVERKERLFGKRINPYFVILCVYNEKKEILVIEEEDYSEWRLDVDTSKPEREFTAGEPSLPGNYLQQHENILECVNRLAENRTGMRVDMVHPLCFAENMFFDDEERIVQKGIVFLAQARKEFDVNRNTTFEWVGNESRIPEEMYMGNRRILRLALEKVKERYFVPTTDIDSQRTARFRHRLHEKTISKVVFHFSSRKIRERIMEILGQKIVTRDIPITILDASCGYDRFLIELASSYASALTIGNDISWQALSHLALHDPEEKVILTNHDINSLPFERGCQFDVVICKNTLHHLHPSEVKGVINRLVDIGRMVIIVEVDDPRRSSMAARLWNYYYANILKDSGTSFLTAKGFETLIMGQLDDDRTVSFSMLSTIKGRYMFAVIEKE
ncbi:MAG: class I SAM-dependent methyltransferase [Thermoplasmata archaeon]|nr:class I SAM-dependent methyltransferase [Thermoplasmata archaeon]